MKLLKLYSNDERFKEVIFKDGLNLIVGRKTKYSNNKNQHNLGKTKIIELINFMLLKDINKGNFLKDKKFIDYAFYLEVLSNKNEVITIKRSLKEDSKVSFKISKDKYNNFVGEHNWDFDKIAMGAKKNKNAKETLNDLLGYDVLTNVDYRKNVNYFLRTQNDYTNEFQLSKYIRSKDIDWKPNLIELLGYKELSQLTIKKYKKEQELDRLEKDKENLEKEFDINIDDAGEYKTDRHKIEREKSLLKEKIEQFDFYLQEQNLNKELVYEIEEEVSELNKVEYRLTKELNKLQKSKIEDVAFDLSKTEKIFKETSIYFGDQLAKSYEELLKFNKIITAERKDKIDSLIELKTKEKKQIEEKLGNLNSKRKSYMSFLAEKDVFKKFKNYQEQLSSMERELGILDAKIEHIKPLLEKEKQINNIKIEIESIGLDIVQYITVENVVFGQKLKDLFSTTVKYILGIEADIVITTNKNRNVEFEVKTNDIDGETTREGEGFTYKKFFCACLDIALLVVYSDKSFFKFAFHDGPLDSSDPELKELFLDYIKKLCEKHNIQYILTIIETEIPKNYSKEREDVNIAINLSDENDDSLLFGFKF